MSSSNCMECANSVFHAGIQGFGKHDCEPTHTCTALGVTRLRYKYSIPRLADCNTRHLFVKQEKTCQTKL